MARNVIPKKDVWKAIREKCLDCSYGSLIEVDNCLVITCPLWEYRSAKARKETARNGGKKDE